MNARERFEATRRAIPRFNEIKLLLMYDGEDWKPPLNRTRTTDTSDPTANRAIFNVDERAEMLEALRKEERELTQFIGESLVIIAAVREGFGDKYADVLDARYIDNEKWTDIAKRYESNHQGKETITTRTVQNWACVALDWVDSVGVSRLLRGEVDV